MVKEAEANKEADEKRKKEADLRNESEQLIFATEKAIKDLGDKVDEKDKEEAEDLIKDLKKELEGSDTDKITELKDKLNEKAMALATKVYEEAAKKAQEEQNNNENSEETKDNKNKKSKDDDVVDAEFVNKE